MNEYLYRFNKVMSMRLEGYETVRWRRKLTRKYSWAVPNEKALQAITKYTPLIEIGAGTGFWAMLLKNRGVKIITYDLYPFKKNLYHNQTQWFPIKKGTPLVLKNYLERNLFLCWPPYNDKMALECLKRFKGKIIIYIGEKKGGCNAIDKFFEVLEKNFQLVEEIKIPQWWDVHDCLIIWSRAN